MSSLFGNEHSWYTDLFDVYRNEQREENGVFSDIERVLISKDNPGRIYRKSTPNLNRTLQNATYELNENLICRIDIDIKAGDEIRVLRGALIGRGTEYETYIAGAPADFYTPFGGVSPELEHKQVVLQSTKVAGGQYVADEKQP